MKKFVKALMIIGLPLVGLIIAGAVLAAFLTPWMDRWGATDAEILQTYPGDELVSVPLSIVNRAVTIQAAPEQIYPWLVQLGAEKGGMYSYAWIETYLLNCPHINADRIHPEWQNLQVGDPVKMCPGDFGPPPYEVAFLEPARAVVLGHKDNGEWVDLWQFVLLPQNDGSTRLVLRTTTTMAGGLWTLIHPGVFIMERAMLLGIQERAEAGEMVSANRLAVPKLPQEIFIRLDPSPTRANIDLPLPCQAENLSVYVDSTAGFCFAYPAGFTLDEEPSGFPALYGQAWISLIEPVQAAFTIRVERVDPNLSLQEQVDNFLEGFTGVEPAALNHIPAEVAGEPAILVDRIPGHLSWRIVFFEHEGSVYRMMYCPVDESPDAQDVDILFRTTQNTFAFIK